MGRKAKKALSSLEHSEEAALLLGGEELPEEGGTSAEPDISVFRPDRDGIRKVLGDLEADVMDYVWESVPAVQPGITVREVYEAFRLRRVIAYTTVMSTMARLARKHLLNVQKVDSAYVYTPSLSKEAFIDNFVARILENLLVSFSNTTEAHLQRLISPDSRERIENLKAKVSSLHLSKKSSGQAEPSNLSNNGD